MTQIMAKKWPKWPTNQDDLYDRDNLDDHDYLDDLNNLHDLDDQMTVSFADNWPYGMF